MTNEEILKAAQNSQDDTGEYEKLIIRKSMAYGAAFGVAICTLMVVVELLVFRKVDFGKPALIFAMAGYINFYEGMKNKVGKRKTIGLIELVLAAIWIVLYIGAFLV